MSAQPMLLPSSPALKVRPVPDRAAPYLSEDDLQALLDEIYPSGPSSSATLRLVPPLGGDPMDGSSPGGHRSKWGLRPGPVAPVDVAPPPSPRAWAAQMAVALLEVTAGSRPAVQVARWTTPEVYRSLVRHCTATIRQGSSFAMPDVVTIGDSGTAGNSATGQLRRTGSARRTAPAARKIQAPWRVRTVVADSPRAGIVEASVIVSDGTRTRAVALRLADRDGRWVAEAFATA